MDKLGEGFPHQNRSIIVGRKRKATDTENTTEKRFRRSFQPMLNNHFLIISIGAVLGANARYWVGDWVVGRLGTTFPYGNLIINLSGSFLLAFFMSLATERFLIDPRWRILIAIGFFGSFTTFSSYTYESVELILYGIGNRDYSICLAVHSPAGWLLWLASFWAECYDGDTLETIWLLILKETRNG